MTENEIAQICKIVAESFSNTYEAAIKRQVPPILVITAMTGALAACATAGGFYRQNVLDALNSAFDDIEQGAI